MQVGTKSPTVSQQYHQHHGLSSAVIINILNEGVEQQGSTGQRTSVCNDDGGARARSTMVVKRGKLM